jgi:hypothetical protein
MARMEAELMKLDPKAIAALPPEVRAQFPKLGAGSGTGALTPGPLTPGSSATGAPGLPGLSGIASRGLPGLPGLPGLGGKFPGFPGKKK